MSKGPSPKSDHLRAAREARFGKAGTPKVLKEEAPAATPAKKKAKKPRGR